MGDTKDESQKTSGNGSNKTLIILGIVVGIVFIAMAATIVILVLGKNKTESTTTPTEASAEPKKREVLITEENVQEVVEQMEEIEYVPPGYYTVTQNYEWHFPDGNSASTDAHVENLPENTNDVYFDLFLADDEDNPIYQSPVIPLGAVLEKFKLDTALEAGTYDCIMVYHLVDSNQDEISTVSMTVTVIVEG
jgi:hypothetical protein